MSRTEPNLLGLAAAALLCAGGAAATHAQSQDEPALVTMSASVVSGNGSLVPGGQGLLAVRFVMADQWHIYWRNPGESGAATKITLDLPEGLTAGSPIWPAPQRYITPGDVLDYVHSGEATFLIPFTIAEDARVGTPMRVGIHADWFVCNEDKCLIGAGDFEWPLTVLDPTSMQCTVPPPNVLWGQLPKTAPPSDLAVAWRGAKLAIRVPDAASLTFFEDSPSDTMPRAVNPLRDGAAEGERLILEFAPETVAPGRVVTGVLTVKRKDGAVTHHEISIPVSGSAIGTDNPQATPKTSDSK